MNKILRKIQIGVMGSMADLSYSKEFEKLAEEIGYWIAKNGATLVFGAEKDCDSLSTVACRGAKKNAGLTVGVTYGKGLEVYEKNVDVVVSSALERGGGRETALVLSCDAIIALGGGSGTLTEIAIAYQANIPVVVLKGGGGWSEKLGGEYLDGRKRIKIETAVTPKKAVEKAIDLASKSSIFSNEILFLGAVHGNEKIGINVLEKLEKEVAVQNFSWVVANQKAFKKGVRFIDVDLNRVAPGKKVAKEYEYERAFELVRLSRNYTYVIDLHGTKAKSGIFIIVTNPKLENLFLAAALPIKKVVIWSSKNSEKLGPITQFVNCGVEIECGSEGRKKTEDELFKILKNIVQKGVVFDKEFLRRKEFFQVYGKVKLGQTNLKKIKQIKEFQKIKIKNEEFYPLLVGAYENKIFYKMRKVNFKQIFS